MKSGILGISGCSENSAQVFSNIFVTAGTISPFKTSQPSN
jgi:hypothetical protein